MFEGSPAEKAGIQQGRLDHRRQRALDRRREQRAWPRAASRARPARGRARRVHARRRDSARTLKVERERIEVPVAHGPDRRARRHEARRGRAARASAQGAHGAAPRRDRAAARAGRRGHRARPARQRRRPAARRRVLVSSIFIEDGKIVSVRGRCTGRSARDDAEGDAHRAEDMPVVVLVDGGSASASEIVTGALRDRDRATVVGTRTFGKGLVQEVEPLSNGGVLDLTVANYYLPGGETISQGASSPQVRAARQPETRTATRRCRWRSTPCSSRLDERSRPAAERAARPAAGGRAREARPLPRGRAAVRARAARRRWTRGGAASGDLVLVGSGKRGARVIRAARPAGRGPRRARGPDARPRPAPQLPARAPPPRPSTPSASPTRPTPASTCTELPTFTIDPDDARDFDDADLGPPRGAAASACGCTSPT